MKKIKILILAVIAGGLVTSCFKDMDDQLGFATTLDIQNFIYDGLNYFYFYKAGTPELADNHFSSSSDLNDFLSGFDSPESLFDYLLVEQDRFSILISDYRILERLLDGVSLDNGMEFGLVRIQTTGEVFGYVRYVLPNTSAAENGVERGMIFNTIDGAALTENNFNELISRTTYTIGLATLQGDELIPTGENITLTKQIYTENPIYISKVLTVQGQKVGYLMYNAFISDFDSQLNAVFADFKAAGITDLVLDLRYNSGGSIETANDLSSMITGQFNDQLFIKEIFNENFETKKRFFNDVLEATGEGINNLNLSRVFILTTSSSASASELVISGLMPYIDVVQVGETTTGKFQGSTVVYDSPTYTKQNVSLGHRYAMLPLILKSVNSAGFTDYADGIVPDILIEEEYTHLGVLGDPDEPLLSKALEQLGLELPHPESTMQPATTTFKPIGESGMNSPIHQRMFID